MGHDRPRLAIVVSHPTQYYSPWFREFASRPEASIRVFYLWDFGVKLTNDPRFGRDIKWDVDLLSGYDSVFVPNTSKRPGAEDFFGFRNPEIGDALGAWNPDAILLFGYAWATHLRVILWAKLHRKPLIFRGDSHAIGRSLQGGISTLLKRLVFREFAAVAYVGEANRDYFIRLGVPDSKLFFAPHSVNAAHFSGNLEGDRRRAGELRTQLGIPAETKVILFAGKLVPAKQPKELLEAFASLADPAAALVYVGEGVLKDELAAAAKDRGLKNVYFLPFANQSEMPSRYLSSDIFALPSRGVYETWGLAVNEAMHCSVPCLVSTHVGCQRDLVHDGITGWVFDADDKHGLAATLRRALADVRDPVRQSALKAEIAKRIANYTYEKTCNGVLAALNAVTTRRQK